MEQYLTLLVLEAELKNGLQEIQLLPFGNVKSLRGDFTVDGESINEIIQAFEAQANEVVVDYEHQTLKDTEAPAAGWIKKLINRGDKGLYAVVEWTKKTKDYLENKEYKYLSPVIFVRKGDRKAVRLHSAAITNTPAIDGMEPLVNKADLFPPEKRSGNNMDLIKVVLKMLGLPEDAKEDQVTQVIKGLQEKAKKTPDVVAHKEVLELLDLKGEIKLEDVKGAILTLKNPSGKVSVEDFNAKLKELEKLQERLALKERDDLVELALSEGKVAPAQKEWAEEYALKDPAGFKAFLTNAPKIVPLGTVGSDKDPGKGKGGIDEVQMAVNKALGVSEEDFKKYNKIEE